MPIFTSTIRTCLLLALVFCFGSFSLKSSHRHKIPPGIYMIGPVGHANGFYVFRHNRVSFYVHNVGYFYFKGTYTVNTGDSTVNITYTKGAHSEYPSGQSFRPLTDAKLKYNISSDGKLSLRNYSVAEEKEWAKKSIRMIKKGATIKIKL